VVVEVDVTGWVGGEEAMVVEVEVVVEEVEEGVVVGALGWLEVVGVPPELLGV
jgi:hypothetical protein